MRVAANTQPNLKPSRLWCFQAESGHSGFQSSRAPSRGASDEALQDLCAHLRCIPDWAVQQFCMAFKWRDVESQPLVTENLLRLRSSEIGNFESMH